MSIVIDFTVIHKVYVFTCTLYISCKSDFLIEEKVCVSNGQFPLWSHRTMICNTHFVSSMLRDITSPDDEALGDSSSLGSSLSIDPSLSLSRLLLELSHPSPSTLELESRLRWRCPIEQVMAQLQQHYSTVPVPRFSLVRWVHGNHYKSMKHHRLWNDEGPLPNNFT